MSAVTQRIPNYLGGISKQSDDQMPLGTLNDCRNAYPDATFGLCKRPGFESVYQLLNATSDFYTAPTFNDTFWFSLIRESAGDKNPYFGCITPAYTNNQDVLVPGDLYLWRADNPVVFKIVTGESYFTSTDPINDYTTVNEQSAVIITNKTVVVTAQSNDSRTLTGAVTNYAALEETVTDPATGDIYIILNSNVPEDDYYLEWTGTAWEECMAPGFSPGLNVDTLPHRLVITDSDATLGSLNLGDRKSGNDTTNPMPSFIGNRIRQTFIYENRLGFLSQDNCTLSQATLNVTGGAYNFFRRSALTLTASDPIDLKTSTVTPAHLINCIPQANGLLLFSTNAIYVLSSQNGSLSPTTYTVRLLSSVEIAEDIMPVAMGTDVIIINKTLSYARALGVTTQGYQEHPAMRDFSKSVEELIPSSVNRLVANTQSEKVCAYQIDSNEFFFYSTYDPGDKDPIRAWYVWETPDYSIIKHMTMWNDQVLAVLQVGNHYQFVNARLTRSNTSVIDTKQGIKANPHLDLFFTPILAQIDPDNELQTKVSMKYSWYPELPTTLIMVDDGNPLTWSSGLIREAVKQETYWMYVEDPDGSIRASINSDDSLARVGVKYAMNARLPRFYFNLGEGTVDTTAHLTVSRAKFTVGRTGACGFKVHSRGNQVEQFTQTDDLQTTFPINFNFKDESSSTPSDVNRIEVMVNGITYILYLDYIITPTREVQFLDGHVPSAGSIITFTLQNEVYSIYEIPISDQYKAGSAALGGQSIEKRMFTVPIHQKNDNFYLSIYTDTPLPVSINSMAWEGIYSPRFYARS